MQAYMYICTYKRHSVPNELQTHKVDLKRRDGDVAVISQQHGNTQRQTRFQS